MEFQERKALVLSLLKHLNVKRAVATYDGSGDSGQVNDEVLAFMTDAEDEKGTPVDELEIDDENLVAQEVLARLTGGENTSLESHIQGLCYDAIDESGHGGWENNEGAEGTLTIHVNDGRVVLEHTSFYTESEQTEHEL